MDHTAAARIAVVGAGNVGATYAYALLLSGLAAEIVLINRSRDVAEGEAMDLAHAVPLTHATRVWVGDWEDCAGAAITVVTVGAPQGDRDSRLELVKDNGEIFAEIIPEIARHNPDGILLIASNPVDVLTYAAVKLSGLPPERVIGSGTILDTARFRTLLGEHLGIAPNAVQAYIIGEHGDSSVPVWSHASVAGIDLPTFCRANSLPFNAEIRAQIARQTREAAAEVADRKGATYYAVAAGLLRITEAILRDQHTIETVSTLVGGYDGIDDVCLSLPAIIDQRGIASVLRPKLPATEHRALRRSAAVIRETIGELTLPG